MNENVENLVLEQLRLIRDDLQRIDGRIDALDTRLSGRMDSVDDRLQSVEGILFGLGGYIRGIDQRVEHIEAKLGIEQ